jgi:hypothetical protein
MMYLKAAMATGGLAATMAFFALMESGLSRLYIPIMTLTHHLIII